MRIPGPQGVSNALLKTALVTGGARRVGKVLVHALVAENFTVAVHYRGGRDDACTLREELGDKVILLQADFTRDEEVTALFKRAEAHLGPIGVLVNNAAIFERDEWFDASREMWDRHMNINLRAPFLLIQAYAQALPDDAQGFVLNLLDQRVWNLTPHFVSYTLAKSGLWTLTQTMALALAPRIRVNAIGPGPVLPATGQSVEHFDQMRQKTLLQRGADPEEIAEAMLALLRLPSVTGQMIALDGGQHLQWR